MYLHITIVLLHFNEFFFQSIPVVISRIFEWMACFELWPLRGHVGGMATADALKIVRVVLDAIVDFGRNGILFSHDIFVF